MATNTTPSKPAGKKTETKKSNTAPTNEIIATTDDREAANEKEATEDDSLLRIDPRLISPSPFQHRRIFGPVEMAELQQDISQHGILTPLTVRPHPAKQDQYELVNGERRLRCALALEYKTVHVQKKELTDREVIEIQLSDNFQRVNPHPMEEARGIMLMQNYYPTIDAIAEKLGKTKKYIFSRLKLLSLIEPIQYIFLAQKFNLVESMKIACLSERAQQLFYKQHCKHWQKKNFRLYDLNGVLDQFRFDLKEAPFDSKNKELIANVGACTHCSFNSSALLSLFPELDEKAVCMNPECFGLKCKEHFRPLLTQALKDFIPTALLMDDDGPAFWKELVVDFPEITSLPIHEPYHISWEKPAVKPKKKDYLDKDDPSKVDENEYADDMAEYQEECDRQQRELENGRLEKGLLLNDSKCFRVLFHQDNRTSTTPGHQPAATAAEVKEAIKNGTATTPLLEAEIERIKNREIRAKELDQEAIQSTVHEKFNEGLTTVDQEARFTPADTLGLRLLVYQSLDHNSREHLHDLIPITEGEDGPQMPLDEWLARRCEAEVVYMVRLSLGRNSASRNPTCDSAKAIKEIAKYMNIDVQAFVDAQQQKANSREKRMEEKLDLLHQKIEQLKSSQ